MTSLFIANCTKQQQAIYYRLDFNSVGELDPRRQQQPAKRSPTIPPGRQITIGGELHITQITDIIEQLKPVGLASVADLNRLSGVVPYLFSTGTAVPAHAIRAVLAHNAGVLLQQGKIRRENAAIAASQAVDTGTFEVEIEQQDVSEAGEARIEEGFRIMQKVEDVPDQVRRKAGRPRKVA